VKVEGTNFSVEYFPGENRILFDGSLRLQGKEEYADIYTLLLESASANDAPLKLDMRGLRFLNSSGISALSLFIIQMRKKNKEITIIGSRSVSWQTKSLRNFQRLYGKVQIDI
jgi:hypothetical protein